MSLSLKDSQVASEIAHVLYNFLPGSGAREWKGHVNFQTIAQSIGVGDFWQGGSKEPAIATLLEKTLESRRNLFETLIISIVKAAIRYRGKNGNPINRSEIETLNGLILDLGFKFPALWEPTFLATLETSSLERANQNVEMLRKQDGLKEHIRSSKASRLYEIRTVFYDFSRVIDRNAAGFELEHILNDLFSLFDLAPRDPFRVTGEQIDGSIMLDNEIYLVEAKWEKEPLSEAPLLIFRGKIEGKSLFTRGIFIAINSFSKPALEAITRGKQANFFLVDGYDLTMIFEGQIPLDELLRKKLRRLAEEGCMLARVKNQ